VTAYKAATPAPKTPADELRQQWIEQAARQAAEQEVYGEQASDVRLYQSCLAKGRTAEYCRAVYLEKREPLEVQRQLARERDAARYAQCISEGRPEWMCQEYAAGFEYSEIQSARLNEYDAEEQSVRQALDDLGIDTSQFNRAWITLRPEQCEQIPPAFRQRLAEIPTTSRGSDRPYVPAADKSRILARWSDASTVATSVKTAQQAADILTRQPKWLTALKKWKIKCVKPISPYSFTKSQIGAIVRDYIKRSGRQPETPAGIRKVYRIAPGLYPEMMRVILRRIAVTWAQTDPSIRESNPTDDQWISIANQVLEREYNVQVAEEPEKPDIESILEDALRGQLVAYRLDPTVPGRLRPPLYQSVAAKVRSSIENALRSAGVSVDMSLRSQINRDVEAALKRLGFTQGSSGQEPDIMHPKTPQYITKKAEYEKWLSEQEGNQGAESEIDAVVADVMRSHGLEPGIQNAVTSSDYYAIRNAAFERLKPIWVETGRAKGYGWAGELQNRDIPASMLRLGVRR
jgi:hypothetical protein